MKERICLVCDEKIKIIPSEFKQHKFVYNGHVTKTLAFCPDCWEEIVKEVIKNLKENETLGIRRN
jgi:hypothetical protein